MDSWNDYEVTTNTVTTKRVYAKSAEEAFRFANDDNVEMPPATVVTEVHISLVVEE